MGGVRLLDKWLDMGLLTCNNFDRVKISLLLERYLSGCSSPKISHVKFQTVEEKPKTNLIKKKAFFLNI